jgi:putative transposase
MIVGMRTRRQAARVAALTGGAQPPGTPKRDGTPQVSRHVDVGADFETHRSAVESVSVLFDMYDGDLEGYAATGRPGQQVPSGWMVTAAKFEVEWPTDPERSRLIRSHFGARRKAFNWGLAQVKADLDARKSDPAHESVEWNQAALRKVWNQAKDEVAPWWAANSKEAYSCGLADLVRALDNWQASKTGKRKGRRVASRASNPRAATRGGRGSPPGRCDSSPIGGPSPCRSSVAYGPRRTLAGCSVTSPLAMRAS